MTAPIPIGGPHQFPPDFPPAGDIQRGGVAERFGAVGARGWKVARMGVVAVEPLTGITRLNCVIESGHTRVQWMLFKPPGVTDYDVTLGRWITFPASRYTHGLKAERFVTDEVHSGLLLTDFQGYQRNERDPICLAITAIVGAPTPWASVPELSRPNNDGAVPPTGFIVLYRGATRE